MAKVKLLIDTDIIIDALKGIKPAKELIRNREIDLYCSIQTKKELLSKVGLTDSERKRIKSFFEELKVLKIDEAIIQKFHMLIALYGERPGVLADYVIAATAWAKNLPLLTRNKKHFKQIKEIKLSPTY
ncbi:MAG: PIN domain-containing protein [Deltaproteobacteria bacterium]|nr:PIN domain-containing protein [Deltaproteobacteria bacterium]